MPEPILIYRKLLDRWTAVASALADGQQMEAPDGVMYQASQLDAVLRTVDLLRVKSAIEAIEGGAQSYAFEGRQFTKADLATLYGRLRTLEQAQAQRAGGALSGRVRQIVAAP